MTARLASVLALGFALAACTTADRLMTLGDPPPFSPLGDARAGARRVAVPMPAAEMGERNANSLWREGRRSFFRDPRAARVGDILTVEISIGDQAKIANTTSRSRKASEDSDLSNFFGAESQLAHLLPEAVDPTKLVSFGTDASNTGAGSVNRSEDIKLTVAAVVTQVLPNGNLVIEGRQEVRVNFEVRELLVSGIVRPEDISNANTINQTQIAEARISYGGRGQLSDVQQPRLGQQLYDILMPF